MTTPAILSAIENEIVRVESQLAELRRRVHVLIDSTNGSGAPTTSPSVPDLPVYLTSSGAYHPRGYWYRGLYHRCHSYKDIYLGLLRAIAVDQPNALDRVAAALRTHGRTRSYLAPNPAQLFRGQNEQWAREHSERIADGWYADTNLSLATMKTLVRRVLTACGLSLGKDVVIVWDRQLVNPSTLTTPRSPTH